MELQWLQPLSYLVAMAVFIWYLRKDSKDDYLRLEAKLEAWRNETNGLIRSIQEEMKDFHGRMCALEGKGKEGK